MMAEVKKYWVLWLISAISAFGVGLLINFPAASAFDRINGQLPPQFTNLLSGIDGSVWNGRGTIRKGALKSTVEWKIDPLEAIFGGAGVAVHLHEIDHDLNVQFGPQGVREGRVQISGQINSELINRQLAQYGIRMSQNVELNSVLIGLKGDQITEASGTVILQGGTVSYTSSGTKVIQMPGLWGQFSAVNGELLVNIVEAGKNSPISVVTFKPDGWFGLQVKPEMASLILLPNRRVNRAGNVLEVKRKVF